MDKFQKAIISHENGPALILAGPGSGKTFCLTHHVKFLIEEMHVPEDRILVFTFTKQAAISMERRFLSLQNNKNHVWFGTFHSIFYRFLCGYSNSPYKIIDNDKKRALLEKINVKNFSIEELSNYISYKKSGNTNLNFTDSPELISSLNLYNEYLNDLNLIDYDDILIKFHELIVKNPSVAKIIKNNFTHVLIDEFQDINGIQYEILKLITEKNGHVFAVGDDDQSIYGFRGASPESMRMFKDDYYNVSVYSLLKNYRSKDPIIKASQIVINENIGRMKEYRSLSLNKEDYDNFNLVLLKDQKEEFEFIKGELEKARDVSVAILLRTNKDVEYYKSIFIKNSGDELILNDIITTIRAYNSFLKTGLRTDFFKLMNVPERYLVRSLFRDEKIDLKKIVSETYGKNYVSDLNKIIKELELLNRTGPLSFIVSIRRLIGLEKYYIKKYSSFEPSYIIGIFDGLEEKAKKLKSRDDLDGILSVSKERDKSDKIKSNVNIMTYHSAKGLEFNEVILPDLVEGKVPGRIALTNAGIEEERRLFYVAMTRAKEKLILLTIKNEESSRLLPSRFLNNLYSSSNSSSSRYSSKRSQTASYSSSESI